MRLEAVDAQHPDTVALVRGPLVLFALADDSRVALSRSTLLAATQTSSKPREWATAGATRARFKSFMDIEDETYTTYLPTHTG